MAIRVSNVRLGLDEPEAALGEELARALGLSMDALGPWRILRKSLDARVKDSFHFVYTAEVRPPDDEALLADHARRKRHGDVRVERYHEPAFELPPPGQAPL